MNREIKFRAWDSGNNQMAYFKNPFVHTDSPVTFLRFELYGWKPTDEYEDDNYRHDDIVEDNRFHLNLKYDNGETEIIPFMVHGETITYLPPRNE